MVTDFLGNFMAKATGGAVREAVTGIAEAIDRFVTTDEEKAKLKLEVLKLGQSAILAEANSQHKFVALARPMFLYQMYLVIDLCVIGGILSIWFPSQVTLAAQNIKALLAAIPEALWALFGAGFLGYTHYRSKDKVNGVAS